MVFPATVKLEFTPRFEVVALAKEVFPVTVRAPAVVVARLVVPVAVRLVVNILFADKLEVEALAKVV